MLLAALAFVASAHAAAGESQAARLTQGAFDSAADRQAFERALAKTLHTPVKLLHQDPDAGDGAPGDLFGISVALSGNTALVGAFRDDTPAGIDAGSAYVFTRSGSRWTRQAKLIAGNGAAQDRFGTAVALSGDTALIGASEDDTPAGTNAGSAYVFTRSGSSWTQQAQLTAGDGSDQDFFGIGVALVGDTALVGTSGARAAYVFTRNGASWTQQARLAANDASSNEFGRSVALGGAVAGNTALIGARDAEAAYVFTRSGASWTQQAKLTADDGAFGDLFGSSVALAAETALVAAPLDDTPAGNAAGSAYVFVRTGTSWTQQAHLMANDTGPGDAFASRVALHGDTALLGVYLDDASDGSAYVFTRSGASWTQQAKLKPNGGHYFGDSVALEGDIALVGAPETVTGQGTDAGAAYTFARSGANWTQQARLTAGEDSTDDRFGIRVAVSGDTALVGSIDDDTHVGSDTGAAYVFVRSDTAWVQQAQLLAGDAVARDNFGSSVALEGDTALVGAPFASGDDVDESIWAGGAYVFTRSGTSWTQEAKLTPDDPREEALFGWSVALSGDTALIGASEDDTPAGTAAGSAYVFTRSGALWTQQAKLTADDAAQDDLFGFSVALDGDTALVGAFNRDANAFTDVGAAYVFTRSGVAWTQQAQLVAGDGGAYDRFGYSVALEGDTALVGAAANDGDFPDIGSAYVFTGSGAIWTQETKLMASDSTAGNLFGFSVALDGDTALVGATYFSGAAGFDDAGAAYVFTRSTGWTQKERLIAGQVIDEFGASVALDGHLALIGAPRDSEANLFAGAAYVFDTSGIFSDGFEDAD